MSKVHEVKPEKVAAVADIVEKLKNAQSVVICSYSGLTVEQVTEIRKQCRENDAAYCVLKNRLVLRALNEVGITGLDDLLNGPNAFVFSMKDAVSGPKIINDYIEKNKLESLKITGGVLGTETLDVAAEASGDPAQPRSAAGKAAWLHDQHRGVLRPRGGCNPQAEEWRGIIRADAA
mgnify:CR=1 FL=1